MMAIVAPIIYPTYPTRLNRVAPNYCAPIWMKSFDPDDPPTQQMLPNPFFDTEQGWLSVSNSDAIEISHQADKGYLIIEYRDEDPLVAYGASEISIESSFEWKWKKRPKAAEYFIVLKYEYEGDFSDWNLRPSFEIISAFGRLSDQYYKPYPKTWTSTTVKLDVFEEYLIFEGLSEAGEGQVTVKYNLRISDYTPSLTGVIRVWIDAIGVRTYSHYYGPLGSSDSGVDVLSQIMWGTQISILIGILSTAIAVGFGLLAGLAAGYYGGKIDELLMRIVDFLLIMPGLPLMMVLAAIVGASFWVIIFVIAFFGWTTTARIIRSQVLIEKEKAYVEAAKAVGASDVYVIFKHVLPNVLSLIFVELATGVASAMVIEANLSFLGLGDPTHISWGRMLNFAWISGGISTGAWWYVLFPGLCIAFLSMAFIYIGYVVDRVLNPKLRVL
ncbi:MAG: ABC transporter permease [Candidatus Bathyarchaeota archaeon]|nr:MAG: ABC transporter permease [Candidatus Bathyarchaeota archaeon]